jgi:lipoprotein-releasing system permease protein
MSFASSFLFARKILFSNKTQVSQAQKNLFAAFLGLALSLVPLILVLVISNGMIEGITNRIIGLSSYHIQVQHRIPSYEANPNAHLQDLFALQKDILSVDGVRSAHVEVQGIALGTGKKKRTGITVRCVKDTLFSENPSFASYLKLEEGLLEFSSDRSVFIGTKLAKELDLAVGDSFYIISAKNMTSGTVQPNLSVFKVAAIVSSGYQELDALWVYVPLSNAYRIFTSQTSQAILGIELEDPFSHDIYRISNEIESFLTPLEFSFLWSDLNREQFENFSSTKQLLLFVMCIIVLVASVNIASALTSLVLERRREIALLLATGVSQRTIAFSFLCLGAGVGLMGLIVGIPIGLLLALHINEIIVFLEKLLNFFSGFWYTIVEGAPVVQKHLLDPEFYLETIPIVIPYWDLFLIAVLSLALSVIVSILPSLRSAKEKPLSVLRKL